MAGKGRNPGERLLSGDSHGLVPFIANPWFSRGLHSALSNRLAFRLNRCPQRQCAQKWSGLFLTFDYGLGKEILLKERPLGTARSYHRHKMGSDLLSKVGEQDLTCHLCWDELVAVLENSNSPTLSLSAKNHF